MAAQPKQKQLSTQQKLRNLRDALLDGLVERDDAVRLALLAAIAGEHLLLIGPPGTAKSMVATRLSEAFTGATFFQKLMTRFTVPEEVFGPFSIRGLEEDRYERKTERYLPTASVAFLDEIFKANSAILNSMLTLLNEREFDNGTERTKTPLVAVVGASNELPENGELDALHDRFLLRLHVGPVRQARFTDLLRVSAPKAVDARLRLNNSDLESLRELAREVVVPGEVLMLLGDLREWCVANDIVVSDRRWLKIVKLLRASAASNDRDTVSIWDCWLLQHCVWSDPDDREAIYDWYAERVGTSVAMDPGRLTRVIVGWERTLGEDQNKLVQHTDEDGRHLYEAYDGTTTSDADRASQKTRDGEPLYLAHRDMTSGSYGQQVSRAANNPLTADELDETYIATRGGRKRFSDWSGRDDYLNNPENWVTDRSNLRPHLVPERHKSIYIDNTLAELNQIRDAVETYLGELDDHITSMDAEIHGHLWVAADFAAPAGRTLDETRRAVAALLERVDAIRAGYETLPREASPSLCDINLDNGSEEE